VGERALNHNGSPTLNAIIRFGSNPDPRDGEYRFCHAINETQRGRLFLMPGAALPTALGDLLADININQWNRRSSSDKHGICSPTISTPAVTTLACE